MLDNSLAEILETRLKDKPWATVNNEVAPWKGCLPLHSKCVDGRKVLSSIPLPLPYFVPALAGLFYLNKGQSIFILLASWYWAIKPF